MKDQQPKGFAIDATAVENLMDIWPRYFPEEAGSSASDSKVRIVAALVASRFSDMVHKLLSRVEDDGSDILSLPIDFQQLQEQCVFIKDELDKCPKDVLLCMGAAAHLVSVHVKKLLIWWRMPYDSCIQFMIILDIFQAVFSFCDRVQDLFYGKIDKVNIRLYNTGAAIALKKLKAAFIKKLVTVCGTAVKVSTVKPLALELKFQCMKCGTGIPRVFSDGKFSPPVCCTVQGCKSRTFTPDRSSAKLMDWQKIRQVFLCSHPGYRSLLVLTTMKRGRVPRTIECELTEDLVDCCIPGEIVTVTGIVEVLNNYMDVGGGKSRSKNQGLYYLYLEAISVRNLKSCADSGEEIRASGICDIQTITESHRDFAAAYKNQHGADVFRQILQSFCPSIYGHELVKGIFPIFLFSILALYYIGITRHFPVNYCRFLIVAHDEVALLLIELQALLEAMEQQCVSVAKAGLVASLSARTSVLAAANPVGGHYDRAKTVNENLKVSAALLSRFDLVFILLDKPDELLDKRVSDHIIAIHTNEGDNFKSNKRIRTVSQNSDLGLGVGGNSVASRLRLHPTKDKNFTPLDGQFLRKYITYSREHVFPRMSKEAAAILKEFYLGLRNRSTCADGTPITARQLESLVRLSEARARVDLREEVTAEDAQDVVDIMKESLYEKYVDEKGFVDFA
ncbi:hypothetical protein HU200_024260 [Digitaria exilis]|uniref:Probable DNA helicase MCM8 n=1 Tax=Digitaria exilis TaxID=1010633 RepID=A0A835C6U4_9POAL|nr:hypothetical protein HU200_024260 [Digitaria exilis]